jgi:ectoine hydroxylase-related dioxygenase (phytanoyl-CoA dioxygenase family)
MFTDQHRRELDVQGYTLIEACMDVALLQALRARIHELFEEEGDRAGHEFRTEEYARRLANLADKGEVFRRAIAFAPVLEGVRHVLGREIKLSSLNARSADPHSNEGQPLHVDMAALPDERGYWVCNTVWMLDDFTADNGATHVVAGSNHTQRKPPRGRDPLDGEVVLEGAAGSVAMWLSQTWHRHGANVSEHPRRGLIVQYGRSWIKPFVDLRTPIDDDQAAAFSPRLRYLLGCNASAPVRG